MKNTVKKNWISREKEKPKKRIFSDLEEIVERILLLRGIDNEEKKVAFLQPDFDRDLFDPFLLTDMDQATNEVLQCHQKKGKVCIFGDYDADGVTATALLKDFFDQIGLANLCYIPDKYTEGYGLNFSAIDQIKKQNVQLIITVDCGIADEKEIAYAQEKGLPVIVLDHHPLKEKIPPAQAVVNHWRDEQLRDHPLAGVGTAFKFVQALAGKIKDFDSEQLKWLLDLVAIGTIADCVPLLGENRILTKFGLIVLSKTNRIGLKNIFQVGSVNINSHQLPTSEQIAFQIAPRINAAGRMKHANLARQLLSAKEGEETKARMLALDLEEKNKHRQKVTEFIIKELEEKIDKKKKLPDFILESSPHWDFGVIGLAAGKIADKYRRPTIILQETDNELRGSGRSIPGINLEKMLRECEIPLKKFGGHAQAVGLSLEKENLSALQKKLSQEATPLLKKIDAEKKEFDLEIDFYQIDRSLMEAMRLMEPFGQANPEPIFFSRAITISDLRLVGNGEKHLKLSLQDSQEEKLFDAIGFRLAEKFNHLKIGDRIDLLYHLQEDNWNGNQKIQLRLIDLKSVDQD